jgi:hypothetical protein
VERRAAEINDCRCSSITVLRVNRHGVGEWAIVKKEEQLCKMLPDLRIRVRTEFMSSQLCTIDYRHVHYRVGCGPFLTRFICIQLASRSKCRYRGSGRRGRIYRSPLVGGLAKGEDPLAPRRPKPSGYHKILLRGTISRRQQHLWAE